MKRPRPNWASGRLHLPNLLGLARVLLTALAVGLLLLWPGSSFGALAGALLLLTAGLTDVADGWLARRRGWQSLTGALTDAYADHLSANLVWVAWAMLGLVGPVVPLLALSRDLVVDWLRQTQALRAGADPLARGAMGLLWHSRPVRALYGGLKLLCALWGALAVGGMVPSEGLGILALGTVLLGLLRAAALLRQALPGLLLHP